MNKSDLLNEIHKELKGKYSKAICSDFLNAALKCIIKGMAKFGKVVLVGFGTFYSSKRKKYTGHNPMTGAPITVPEATVPKFRAGKDMKEEVNH